MLPIWIAAPTNSQPLFAFRFSIFAFSFPIKTIRPQQNPGFVRNTFSAIAERYDVANHLLSGGMDFLWRAKAARLVAKQSPSRILDLAAGSGDLALALADHCQNASVVAADFCLPMLEVARKKKVPALVQADGLQLPFQDRSFDVVTVAFGLRNMASWEKALEEMHRVLRPNGLILVMDFSLPSPPLRGLYRIYLHHVLPLFAAAITGNKEAYEYLGESIESFPRGPQMRTLMESCGFAAVEMRSLFFGVAAITTASSSSDL